MKQTKINGIAHWVKIEDDDMGFFEKMYASIKWRLNGIKRHIRKAKSVKEGLIRWFKLRRLTKEANKRLMKEVERLKNEPPHEPPTQEEVADFVKWAENSGIRFANRVQPMPKTPVSSCEVDLTTTGF